MRSPSLLTNVGHFTKQLDVEMLGSSLAKGLSASPSQLSDQFLSGMSFLPVRCHCNEICVNLCSFVVIISFIIDNNFFRAKQYQSI